ncbi:Uncharacterised protein [Oligella urethralis]|nr:Uncharacterised protein [Oligella urethralis]
MAMIASWLVWMFEELWSLWLLLLLLLKLINFNLNSLRVLLILLPVMVLINLFDYLIRVPMINHYGIETRGTVTSVENTSFTLNFNSVKRHRVRYTLAEVGRKRLRF